MKKKTSIVLILLMLSYYVCAKQIDINRFPSPQTVSLTLQPLVSAVPMTYWNDHPKTPKQWQDWVNTIAQFSLARLPELKQKFQVSSQPITLGGVSAFMISPKSITPENKNRILLHFHGGGYVLNPGEAGIDEAIMMAGYGNINVISIDYRMPPNAPFPAAIEDALSAYAALLEQYPASHIGVFGTSTGGGITLALMLKAKTLNLALPAAIVVGTPWTDLTNTGDTYVTNEGIDNVLVSYDGWLGDAAQLYAGKYDLKHPLISPLYGDVRNLPPTLLFTGTRDLFLSNTIRMHLKLKDVGVKADLIVFEGLSHAQYLMTVDAPETQRYFYESRQFFNQYLAKSLHNLGE